MGVYRVPTDAPESDGTLEWDSTTLVAVHLHSQDKTGFGYTYANQAAATVIETMLLKAVSEKNPLDHRSCLEEMTAAIRNNGDSGLCRMAVAAVDNALWDLKGKLLDQPVCHLLGRVREEVPAYGSGGFTSYSDSQLREQLSDWVARGCSAVKMKIGRNTAQDPQRIAAAREAIGEEPDLFVDANGAYGRRQAAAMSHRMRDFGVTWFEEPVVHSDLPGLSFVREKVPQDMRVSAGEYGFELGYFHRLLEAGAVDAMMIDATRCGLTGFLSAAEVCRAHHVPVSSHCAPSLHLHACLAAPGILHMEYFHDHGRIERRLFEGAPDLREGKLKPDLSRPGLGIELKQADAEKYEVR